MSERAIRRTGQILLAAMVVAAAWVAWRSPFVLDEWEHLHAAWKVARGESLYVDFFEHHHPPLYLLLAPLVSGWWESAGVMAAARGLQLLLVLGCLFLAGNVGRALAGPTAGWWTAACWLAFAPVLMTTAKVRPDTPMTLLLFAAVLLGLRALFAEGTGGPGDRQPTPGPARETDDRPRGRARSSVLPWLGAGASAAAAAWFSSKALLFLPVLALFPAVAGWRRWMARGESFGPGGWRRGVVGAGSAVAYLMTGALGPLLVALGHLVATGTLGGFRDWCVRFNWSFVTLRFPGTERTTGLLMVHERPVGAALAAGSTLVLLLALVGAWRVVRRGDREVRALLLGGSGLPVLVLWLGGRGLYWDLLPALLFPAVLAGVGVVSLLSPGSGPDGQGLRSPRVVRTVSVLLGLGLLVQPMVWASREGARGARVTDRARLEYVLERTGPEDVVHQEWPLFNLFRPDAAFFWFAAPAFAPRARHLGLASDYDLREVVSGARPAYVSVLDRRRHHDWMVEEAGYRWLPELEIYERRPPPGVR